MTDLEILRAARAKTDQEDALAALVKENASLKRALTFQRDNNHRRNVELDALHYVWCNGGCRGGVHRFTEGVVTEELVAAAERNTQRLRTWLENHKARVARNCPTTKKAQP